MQKKKKTPEFIDKAQLSAAQLTDPDYRLKMLNRRYGRRQAVSCSRCHHCR